MKRIIDGKRYDTETATLVHEWDNGRYASDFSYRSKDLYRTLRGSWFILHAGGAMTGMAVAVGSNGRGGSSAIEPVSPIDALRFLESHRGEEAIEKYFDDQLEDA